jgi:hypothetical protein
MRHHYEPLDDTDENVRSVKADKRPYRQICLALVYVCIISGAIIALTPFIPVSGPSEQKNIDCGRSAAEARARGCHYEAMLRSWIPDPYYTPEPADEYQSFDDREWFFDKNQTKPMKVRAFITDLSTIY